MNYNSNFRSFSIRSRKLKNNPTYPSASGCADPKIAPDLTRRPVDLFWQSMKIFYNIFHKKVLSEMDENGKAFFSRPRMKVESTLENARKTSNTGSKSYVCAVLQHFRRNMLKKLRNPLSTND